MVSFGLTLLVRSRLPSGWRADPSSSGGRLDDRRGCDPARLRPIDRLPGRIHPLLELLRPRTVRRDPTRSFDQRLPNPAVDLRHPIDQIGAIDLDHGRERMIVRKPLQVRVGSVAIVGINAPLLDVGEEGGHPVEVTSLERVELVVVALRAPHGRAEPGDRHGPDPVPRVLGEVLLGLGAPFASHHIQAVESGGHELLGCRVGQEIAGELFDREPVEGHVAVKGVDHVIAIGEAVLILVAVIAHRVGEPDQVEPGHRHPLAIMGRGQEPVDHLLVCVGGGIGLEGVDLLGRRRQADQVEAESADQGPTVGLGRGLDAPGLERGEDEGVDRILDPGRLANCRDRRPPDRLISPVGLIPGTLGDPSLEQLFLDGRELLGRPGRGHDLAGIVAQDSSDQLALLHVRRDDRALGQGDLAEVESEVGLAVGLVGTVAKVAVLGQDRPDVAVELDRPARPGLSLECHEQGHQDGDRSGMNTVSIHRREALDRGVGRAGGEARRPQGGRRDRAGPDQTSQRVTASRRPTSGSRVGMNSWPTNPL